MPSSVRRTLTRPRPWSARAAISLLALFVAVIGLPVPAVAAASPIGPLPTDPTTTGAGTVDLTLVTGDTVHVGAGPDGRLTAAVSPADRADGSAPGFWIHGQGDDLYVIPQDVVGLLPERLDPSLFNVSALLAYRLSDTESSSLPLIVTYQPGTQPRLRTVPSDGPVQRLESVNGLALRIDKAEPDDTAVVRQALQQLAGAPAARTLTAGPFAGIEKIWLDQPIQVALDQSTGQIGAPVAWQAGYDGTGVRVAVLDTGIDSDHPDLVGKVVAEKNFTDSNDTVDRQGHGTHVASTVAGSGAASAGQYTGVAPGVELLNGKVLNDFGFGSTSGVIEGMEWAAAQGADIINMSLGERGRYTDGTDPASLAVNSLTEQYGTLFVIAAGNDGPRAGTVTTPATADLALTVGSVDKSGAIADSSSRGPRAGDLGLKPDITAPGVHIAAARAEGTALCEFQCSQPVDGPIDEYYTSASGTSMAAPHVAGAAALIAQARPDLDAMQLKALLMGTSDPSEALTVYDQGAGEADVAAALAGQLVTSPASVGFGYFDFPHDQRDPITRTVTYTNLGDTPQQLDLEVTAENGDGTLAPEGTLTLSPRALTVPANGTATVRLSLDTSLAGDGQYGGALVARGADGATIRTPVGYVKEPEMYNLRVEGIARDGRAAYGRFQVLDVEDGSVSVTRNWDAFDDGSCTTDPWAASNCLRVPPGTYSISGLVFTMPQWAPSDQPPQQFGSHLHTSLVVEPEITIDGTTTLTMDAREAVEVQIDTPDHPTKRNNFSARQISYYRVPEVGEPIRQGFLLNPRSQLEERMFLQPTEPVRHGELAAHTQWELAAPAITLEVLGTDPVPLNPLYYDQSWFSTESGQFPQLRGSHRLPVADGGTATAAELDGRDLDGTLAVVRRSDAISVAAQSNNAAAAGAAMVAIYNDVPGSNAAPGETGVRLRVPTVRLSHAEGTDLLRLREQRPVTVRAEGQPVSPYRYHLPLIERGSIPADLHYVVEADQLAAVENSFHSQVDEELSLTETWYAFPPWEDFAVGFPQPSQGAPSIRTDYYLPGGIAYSRDVSTPEAAQWPQPQLQFQGERRTFAPGERVRQSWLRAPLRPGLRPGDPIQRAGDQLQFNLAAFVDGAGHIASANTSPVEDGFATRLRVYTDGALIAEGSFGNGILPVPAGPGQFRIEYEVDNNTPWAQLSRSTRSVWRFGSVPPAPGQTRIEPLLTVDYEVAVDLRNTATKRGAQQIGLTVAHQPGAAQLPIARVQAWASYDDGTSWDRTPAVGAGRGGQFQVVIPPNRRPSDAEYLSLRITAVDIAGNSVEQEIIRAYRLS